VTTELLEPHYDGFRATLEQLEGFAQYVVKGRYVEQAILSEILAENPLAADLATQVTLAGRAPPADRDCQIQLGEMIGQAVAVKREQDTQVLGDALAGPGERQRGAPRPRTSSTRCTPRFLAGAQAGERLEQALTKLAADWAGRIELQLTGPLAAYDFVGTPPPGVVAVAVTGGLTWGFADAAAPAAAAARAGGHPFWPSSSRRKPSGNCTTRPMSGTSLRKPSGCGQQGRSPMTS